MTVRKAQTSEEFASYRPLRTLTEINDFEFSKYGGSNASQPRKLTFWNVVVPHEIRRIVVRQFYFGDAW